MLKRLIYVLVFVALVAERPNEAVFYNYWRTIFTPVGTLFFTALPGLRLPLWHVLVIGLMVATMIKPSARRHRARPLDRALAVSFLGVLMSVAWGMARGGSFYQSFFQLQFFMIGLALTLLLLAALRTPRAIAGLGRVVLLAALTRAALAIAFYFLVVRRTNPYPWPTYMTSHDDSVLFVVGIVIVVSWALARRTWLTWAAAVPSTVLIIYAIKLNQRRVAWLCLVVSALVVYSLLRRIQRRRFHRFAVVAVPVLAIYIAIGWGQKGGIFAPVGAFSSMMGEKEDDSSKSRNVENDGLLLTLREGPLLGKGWGHPYDETSTVYSAGMAKSFPQYRFIPHNSVLGIAAFTGILGFLMIWGILPVGCFLAARTCLMSRTAVERAGGMTAAAGILTYANMAYADMGFQSLTAGVVLAACLLVAGRLSVRSGAWPAPRPVPAPPAVVAPVEGSVVRRPLPV